jgi:hypothetical protein
MRQAAIDAMFYLQQWFDNKTIAWKPSSSRRMPFFMRPG